MLVFKLKLVGEGSECAVDRTEKLVPLGSFKGDGNVVRCSYGTVMACEEIPPR